MRIHTNTLTISDIHRAARLVAGGIYVDAHEHGSRSHTRAFEVRLYADTKVPGDGRRKTNSGHYGAGESWAATWDEWGNFLAYVFAMDPTATVPRVYADGDDFHARTGGEYRLNPLVADGFSVLDKEGAREIAAAWQSPGSIGWALAAFASGAYVTQEDLLDDIQATINENGGPTSELQALRTYVSNAVGV